MVNVNWYYLELIWYNAIAELRAEAARAYLGFFWWVFEPVLYMVAFYIVFAIVFQRGGSDFVPFLLCGLVVWKWFGSAVAFCANSIPSNSGLMSQVYLPKYLFPMIILLNSSIKFIIIFGLFVLFLLVYGIEPSASWLSLPVIILVQFLFIAFIAGLVASIVPLVPDIKLILDNVLMLLFFLSGIFFDISVAPEDVKFYLLLNPMAVLIESYRAVLIDGLWPNAMGLSLVFFGSSVGLWFVYRIFKHYDRIYPKILV